MGNKHNEPESENDDQFFEKKRVKRMLELERDQVLAGRQLDKHTQLSGIGLSGGGIRSAIFCLGALQALAARGILSRIDYMSSVSGGGYALAAIQWIWSKDALSGTAATDFPYGANPGSVSGNANQTKRLDYLRWHGQYLIPGEGLNIWSASAVVTRTAFLNLAVWLPIGTILMVALILFFRVLQPYSDFLPNPWSMIMASAWHADCTATTQGCLLKLELAFGAAVWATIAICTGFALWALAFSLDTRVSPSQTPIRKKHARLLYYSGIVVFGLTLLCFTWAAFGTSNLDPLLIAAIVFSVVSLAVLSLMLILLGRQADNSSNYRMRRKFETVAGAWLPWLTILFAFGTVPILPYVLLNNPSPFFKAVVAGIGAASGVFSATAGHQAASNKETPSNTMRWILMGASAAFIYSLAILAYFAAQALLEPSAIVGNDFLAQNLARGFVLSSVVIALCLCFITNVNYVGLHRFYRDRLMEAFMPDAGSVEKNVVGRSSDADRLSMTDLWPPPPSPTNRDKRQIPYPIINTNAILVNDSDRKTAWRGGDNFIISPLFVGSSATGWERTHRHIAKHGTLTLASAMAVSGAATTANAGYVGTGMTRDRLLSIVMMLLNIRLAMWIGLPSKSKPGKAAQIPNHFNPSFLYGLLGRGYKRQSSFIEISDGGHFDNLGLYELIRRELPIILIVDGEEDALTAMPALYSVSRRVEEDFGTQIALDACVDDLVPQAGLGFPEGAKYVKRPFFAARISYGDNKFGALIYVKLSLAEGIGFGARGYRAQNSDFPHQSTMNQFFVPEQVEAYRDVGHFNMSAAISALGLDTQEANDPEAILKKYQDARTATPTG